MQSEHAVAVAGVAGGVGAGAVGVAGNGTEQPVQAVAVGHVNATAKVEILQKMLDERALLRRVKDRWEDWKRYDAATFIRVCMYVLLFAAVFGYNIDKVDTSKSRFPHTSHRTI